MNSSFISLNLDSIYKLLNERFNNNFLSLKDLPHPNTFKDMEKSVNRIAHAINSNQKIILIGDYDVDGVISTSIMKLFFEELEYPLEWIIPNRFRDGYGLSVTLIPRIKDADLVITVDNGISAVQAAQECKKLGIDLIITDHHIVPDIEPQAYAIINQKQNSCTFPFAEICGAQIAWYLCSMINVKQNKKIDMKSYLELVSIAIIADIMPLLHINRAMVQAGIKLLDISHRPFLKAYKEQSNKDHLVSEDIAYSLAPILNSAGRLEDASLAVEFICSTNIYEARTKLNVLVSLNEQRKALEQQITDEAVSKVKEDSKVIVVYSREWHEGVVGIVAARLARKFERPAIVLSQTNSVAKGSGRSFYDCNLFNLVEIQREILDKFGGHKAAIGMSIEVENIEEFDRELNQNAISMCSQAKYIDPDILGYLSFSEIDFTLIDTIAQFEPFGESNTKPKFITKSVTILAVQTMGKDANHLRFTFEDKSCILNAVQFKTYERYELGEKVDVVYTISKNNFRGKSTIQLMVDSLERN